MNLLWVLVGLVVPGVALSLDMPSRSRDDARIQRVVYNPEDVVKVEAALGRMTHIVLEPGEEVLDKGAGFTAGWELATNRNHLFVKPKSVSASGSRGSGGESLTPIPEKWRTNLTIVTQRRNYAFELVLLDPEKAGMNPAYRIVFSYPEVLAEREAKEAERRKLSEALERQNAPKNWAYSFQAGEDSEDIVPTMAYDDGRFTYLRFPGNRDFPTVYLKTGDKGETLVNWHVDAARPDILVLHRIGREFVLRLSKQVVSVYNERFDPLGIPSGHGTTREGVIRVLKRETGEFPLPDEAAPVPEFFQDDAAGDLAGEGDDG